MRKELAREVALSQAFLYVWGIRLPHCINKWHGQARSLKKNNQVNWLNFRMQEAEFCFYKIRIGRYDINKDKVQTFIR